MIKIDFEAKDVQKQVAKMAFFDTELSKTLKDSIEEGIKDALGAWGNVIPRKSGAYVGSITGELKHVSGVVIDGLVKAGATNRGYPYPRMLEYSPKHKWRTGGKTKGSVQKAVEKTAVKTRNKIKADLDHFAEKMTIN